MCLYIWPLCNLVATATELTPLLYCNNNNNNNNNNNLLYGRRYHHYDYAHTRAKLSVGTFSATNRLCYSHSRFSRNFGKCLCFNKSVPCVFLLPIIKQHVDLVKSTHDCTYTGWALTVLPIIQNFKVLLGSDGQRLLDHGDGVLRGERTIEELASSWSLHNLGTAVARQAAETVRAVDDVTQTMLSVGHQETAICNKNNSEVSALWRQTQTKFHLTKKVSNSGVPEIKCGFMSPVSSFAVIYSDFRTDKRRKAEH